MTKRLTMTEDEAMHVLGYTNKTGRYKFSDEEKWKEAKDKRTDFRDGIVDAFGDHCEERGIDKSNVIEYWDKTDFFSVRVRPEATKDDLTPEYIKEVISGINFDKKPIVKQGKSNEILRVIITDVHIGMETDESGYGMFNEVWNEKEAFKRLDIVLEECARVRRNFKEVHVIDAGDYMDGWDGQTTRGGHKLPQNLSNRKAFDVGVRFKTELYNRIQELMECPLVAYNVCNDNHSSDFGFIVNETVRMICEKQNPNITVNNLQRFMSHYTFGDHTFILCHGKDNQHMRYGLKPKLDAVIKSKIMQYIKHYEIKSRFITFEKGDSHQQLLDSTSSDDFEYFNYRAFSPASSWVSHNFGKSTSGFTLMTVRSDRKSKGIEAIEF